MQLRSQRILGKKTLDLNDINEKYHFQGKDIGKNFTLKELLEKFHDIESANNKTLIADLYLGQLIMCQGIKKDANSYFRAIMRRQALLKLFFVKFFFNKKIKTF